MSQSPGPVASPLRGILLMIGSMLVFATMDGVSKHLVQTYSIAQIFMVRYLVFIVFALWICRRIGVRRALVSKRPGLQIARTVLLIVEGMLFVLAFRYLGLAETHAIVSTTPLLVTVLAALFLAEKIGFHRWLAVVAGLAGALIIIRPGVIEFSWPILIPLAVALTYAPMQIQTRMLGKIDRGETTLLYTALGGLAIMLVAGPFFWVWPEPEIRVADLALMVLAGLLASIAHYLLILAYRHAAASVLQPYSYFLLAWVALVGLIGFGEFPDRWTIVGAAIIVAGGLYTFARERRALVANSTDK